MSLTVKHLNGDASFLLSFQPILPFPPTSESDIRPFTILLDPWITGTSKVWHSKFSISRQKQPSCISSLTELSEPNLVVISQDKPDHCHKETLTQLSRTGGKTIILAEPASAKIIRSWRHFNPSKVHTLLKWERKQSKIKSSSIHRIAVPPQVPHGTAGEVTITFMAQPLDITGLHSAIGITYRPPTFSLSPFESLPPTPPDSPRSCQSTFSASITDRTLSVIFSPHGCNYKTLAPYVTSHLVAEAALPLTVLLHCYDRVQNAWYMGGNICSGFPGGLEIAQNLEAQVWISAHDSDKENKGFANNKIVIRKFPREEVESMVSLRSAKFPERRTGTEAVVLIEAAVRGCEYSHRA
ncbi:hypothetical protein BJ878DRAFT_531854 [Calycina marina]|uniref:Uncharacterized protein n=1 Tax=Calycina marina TaxID=1763456 RepID=A0A9P8CKG0_9HELO|nr:hypothetical protein BJ878DRAFT_531854 [Calycina marina]